MGKNNLLEIGCGGNALFLEMLTSDGFEVEGMDPSYTGNNPKVKKETFHGSNNKVYSGIILRHVLEHIPDPYDFLHQIKISNQEVGFIYIEVPCFDWINNNCEVMDIFYEHVNYFRKEDCLNLFQEIITIDYSFGGQYLSLVAKLSSLKNSEDLSRGYRSIEDYKLNELFYEKFNRSLEIVKEKSKILVWGVASKGSTFVSLLKSNNIDLKSKVVCVDINCNMKNKFLPGTGCEIFYPSNLFLTKWGKRLILCS